MRSTAVATLAVLLLGGSISNAETRLSQEDLDVCKYQLEQVISTAQSLGNISNEMTRLAASGGSAGQAFTKYTEQVMQLKQEKADLLEICKIQ